MYSSPLKWPFGRRYIRTPLPRGSAGQRPRRAGAGEERQGDHGERQSHPRGLGEAHVHGLRQPVRQAPVPQGRQYGLHHRQDGGVSERHRCPHHHHYGVHGRHLALGVRRHVHLACPAATTSTGADQCPCRRPRPRRRHGLDASEGLGGQHDWPPSRPCSFVPTDIHPPLWKETSDSPGGLACTVMVFLPQIPGSSSLTF